MNNPAFLRTLIIFSLIVPLAVFTGYMLSTTSQWGYSTFALMGVFVLALAFPLLMRWHYPLLLLSWNMTMTVFFIKGEPEIYLTMIPVSLGVSILESAMSRTRRFIWLPQVALPLAFFMLIALITAELTGGIGLHAYGSEIYGGKKYIYLLAAVLGYFALTARRIPPERAPLYVMLFFLGGVTSLISDLYIISPRGLDWIFWFFPPDTYAMSSTGFAPVRYAGTVLMSTAIFSYMLARYGLRNILTLAHPARLALFILFSVVGLFGGFRVLIISYILMFTAQFFLEGLHRTKLLPILTIVGLLAGIALIPLARHLPYTFQRALSFLPLKISVAARQDADYSLDWRLQMWQELLPQIPDHLLLGKGYAITRGEYEMMGPNSDFRAIDAANQGLALADDYHNGPLSIILPFGIWGVIAIIWFFAAGLRVVYCNYRYGEPALHNVNTFLFAAFLARILFFLFVFGSLNTDMLIFVGWLGLSVALNGGVCRPGGEVAEQAEPENELDPKPVLPFRRPSLQPAFPRRDYGANNKSLR